MSKAAKLRTARTQAIRALKRVERAQEEFARDYAAFPSVLQTGLEGFKRTRAGLIAAIETVDREIAALTSAGK